MVKDKTCVVYFCSEKVANNPNSCVGNGVFVSIPPNHVVDFNEFNNLCATLRKEDGMSLNYASYPAVVEGIRKLVDSFIPQMVGGRDKAFIVCTELFTGPLLLTPLEKHFDVEIVLVYDSSLSDPQYKRMLEINLELCTRYKMQAVNC